MLQRRQNKQMSRQTRGRAFGIAGQLRSMVYYPVLRLDLVGGITTKFTYTEQDQLLHGKIELKPKLENNGDLQQSGCLDGPTDHDDPPHRVIPSLSPI